MSNGKKPSRFAEVVAANVTALRVARGLTVAQAAKRCGVSPRTWTFFEHPGDSTGAAIGGNLDVIAAAFGVTLASLLDHRTPAISRPEKETKHAAKSVRRYARKSV